MKTLDDISDLVCKVCDPCELILSVISDHKTCVAAEDAVRTIQELIVDLNQDPRLETAARWAHERRDKLNAEEAAVASQLLVEFAHQGSSLPTSEKEKHSRLQVKMHEALEEFRESPNDPRDARKVHIDKPKMNSSVHRYFPTQKGQIVVNCSDPSQQRLALPNISDEGLREELSWSDRPNALAATESMIRARHAVSTHLGFESYSHYYAWHRSLKTPGEIFDFLDSLHLQLQPKINEELNVLKQLKFKDKKSDDIKAWDVAYYVEKATSKLEHENAVALSAAYSRIPSSTLEEYFTLENVLKAAQLLWSSLFGVRMEFISEGAASEIWHTGVFRVDFYDESKDEFLGHAYLDLISRSGKPGAANFPLRLRSARSKPSTALLLHLPPHSTQEGTYDSRKPSLAHGIELVTNKDVPVLVPFDGLKTFFHELGHLSQGILCENQLQHFSGTRGLMDHIETPSQVMELFATDWRFVSTFARHYKTGQPLPRQVFDAHLAIKGAFSGLHTNEQLVMSALDQRLHSGPFTSSIDILHEITSKYSSVKPHPKDVPHAGFQHLYGYGSVYYSYLFCGVKASQIYANIFAADPLSRKAGQFYRENFLALGGAADPSLLLKTLTGTTTPDPSHFVKDICSGTL